MQDYSEALRLFRSKDFYQVIKYEEPRIRHLYENMRHEILNEVQNEMVYNDILIWMDKI